MSECEHAQVHVDAFCILCVGEHMSIATKRQGCQCCACLCEVCCGGEGLSSSIGVCVWAL